MVLPRGTENEERRTSSGSGYMNHAKLLLRGDRIVTMTLPLELRQEVARLRDVALYQLEP